MMANFSCGNSNSNEKALAKVGDKYLYANEIQIDPSVDSIQFIKKFTSSWIEKQILLENAAEKNSATASEIDEKVEQYRKELDLAQYEKSFLDANLDTLVTDVQLEKFYTAHKNLFELRDYVVNVFYMKFDISENGNSKIGSEIENCKSMSEAKKIEEKYAQLSVNSFSEPNTWLFLSDLQREVPLKITDKSNFLTQNSFIKVEDDENLYYVRIFDYKLKNETSPLKLVKPKIKNIVLRNRSQELIAKNRKKIINEYSKSNEVENYTK